MPCNTLALACHHPFVRTHLQANGVAASFNNSREVLEALQQGVVLCDRSHWGRIRVAGDGRTSFMHNQTTNDFNFLKAGQGCDTVRAAATVLLHIC